jgi:hypothetical protein
MKHVRSNCIVQEKRCGRANSDQLMSKNQGKYIIP